MYTVHRDETNLGAFIDLGSSRLPIRQVLGVGLNYAAHAKEQGSKLPEHPLIFTKSPNAVQPAGPSAGRGGSTIIIPRICQSDSHHGGAQTDFEGELVVVIGRGPNHTLCNNISKADALNYVLGYAPGNDVSARWWQKQGSGGQFNRGKSFDTFAPLGDITPAAKVPNPNALRLVTRVNGTVMQDSTTSDMIFDVATLIADLSRGWTLVPGTLIYTGTPSGVGMARTPQVWLKPGDTVEVEIEGLGGGVCRSSVAAE